MYAKRTYIAFFHITDREGNKWNESSLGTFESLEEARIGLTDNVIKSYQPEAGIVVTLDLVRLF